MRVSLSLRFFFFFFNDTATTEIYTLSLHDALPILGLDPRRRVAGGRAEAHDHASQLLLAPRGQEGRALHRAQARADKSEEHTSELQSHLNIVCRLLL